jgi:hypothetical protein
LLGAISVVLEVGMIVSVQNPSDFRMSLT